MGGDLWIAVRAILRVGVMRHDSSGVGYKSESAARPSCSVARFTHHETTAPESPASLDIHLGSPVRHIRHNPTPRTHHARRATHANAGTTRPARARLSLITHPSGHAHRHSTPLQPPSSTTVLCDHSATSLHPTPYCSPLSRTLRSRSTWYGVLRPVFPAWEDRTP